MMESAALTTVDQARLAGTASVDMSVWGLFMQADTIGKTVMIGLLIVSVLTWGVIFDKWGKLSRLKKRAAFFEERFWSASSIEAMFEKIKRPADPMQAVFVSGMKELHNASDSGNQLNTPQGRSAVLARIDRLLLVTIGREMSRVETWMTFLASVSSAAPFLGLFGTVWGIMRSFIGIAKMQNTSLVVVAPGIAEALLTTAVGLIAAIPAMIAYNKFTTEIGRYGARLDNFANDLLATISRKIEER